MNGLTRHQAAVILGTTDQTITNYCKSGLLGYCKGERNILYVNADDVEKYKDKLRMTAASEELIKSKQRSLDEERKRVDVEDRKLRMTLMCDKQERFSNGLCNLVKNIFSAGIIPFLTQTEVYVLCEFIDGSKTVEIADRRGLTPERIRQIISKAISWFSDVPNLNTRWRNYHEIMNENAMLREDNEMLRRQMNQKSGYEMSEYLKTILNTRLADLAITVRSLNVLCNFKDGKNLHKLETVRELLMCPGGTEGILSQRNCGKKTLREITDIVDSLNLSFKHREESEIDFYRRLESEIGERRGE